jgi:hypothetical protein
MWADVLTDATQLCLFFAWQQDAPATRWTSDCSYRHDSVNNNSVTVAAGRNWEYEYDEVVAQHAANSPAVM